MLGHRHYQRVASVYLARRLCITGQDSLSCQSEKPASPLPSSPGPAATLSATLFANLKICSWLRLLPTLALHCENTLATIQVWLKEFYINANLAGITEITAGAKSNDVSPLKTAEFRK
ncbi:unnamed protein product [Diplocarpon coronariae]|nr:hypothetical protein JHW43_006637 [Diplocarpon mali]